MLRLANFVAGALLLIGIAELPYGYYTFLRIVVFLVSLYSAYQIKDAGKNVWILLYVGLAILFNPIIPIYLYDKEVWMVIDGLAGIFMLFGGYRLNESILKKEG